MRISDWSSDVCSSDLRDGDLGLQLAGAQQADAVGLARAQAGLGQRRLVDRLGRVKLALLDHGLQATDIDRLVDGDRKSGVSGQSGAVLVGLGGRRLIKKKR